MTKTLTEQWRERTLPKGLYYTRSSNGHKGFSTHTGSKNYMFSPYDKMAHQVEEVLSSVPSYDEYQRLVSNSDESSSKTLQLEKRLEIATKALKEYADRTNWIEGNFMCVYDGMCFADEESAEQALKEMEGVK